jgi:ABC-type Fe3+/spermidine/putrescine transport system ATPase subunit
LPGVGNRFPAELSGGQQQRVAVARAVAHSPRVLLMDEPLGALDLKLREAMQGEISAIQRALKITTIYVTHDQAEAMSMSDRIAVMNEGVVEQLGVASDIYNRPHSRFVADFVGQINLIEGEIGGSDGGFCVVAATGARLRSVGSAPVGAKVAIGVRPEQMSIFELGQTLPAGFNALQARVRGSQFAGHVVKVELQTEQGLVLVVENHPNAPALSPGVVVQVAWDPQNSAILAR